ncbi:MAG: nicotinate (nicotinamide) nucleotide adenylyltransferase [Actinobacteria bacterium]|nr:nicotinate (nicotinamide) nucleotide adenylyltransferase [Actinomycetota bacterium]
MKGAGRVGVLGGTFDPPHVAHVLCAVDVRHALTLDRMLLVVANDPWQKRGARAISPAKDRLAMVAEAVRGVEGVEASDLEIRRGGASFTADTVDELLAAGAGEVLVVVGSDAAALLPTWRRAEELAERATFVVVERPGWPVVEPPGFRLRPVVTPHLDISSSAIRRRVEQGEPIVPLVARGVATEISRRRLYAGSP